MARGRGRRQHTRWGPDREEEGRPKSQKKTSQLKFLGPGPPQAAQQQGMEHQRMKHVTSGNTNSKLLQSQPSVRVVQALLPGKRDEQFDPRRVLVNEHAAQAACSSAAVPQREPASASSSAPALQHTKPARGTPCQAQSMPATQQPQITPRSKFTRTLTSKALHQQMQLSVHTHRMETELQQLARTTAAMPSAQTGVAHCAEAPAVTADTPVTSAIALPSMLVRSSALIQSRSMASNSPMRSDCNYLKEWSPSKFLTEPLSPCSMIATASQESPHQISLQHGAQQTTPEGLQQWFACTLEAHKQDPAPEKARQRLRSQMLDSDVDCVQAAEQEIGSVQTGIYGTMKGPGECADDCSYITPVKQPTLAAATEVGPAGVQDSTAPQPDPLWGHQYWPPGFNIAPPGMPSCMTGQPVDTLDIAASPPLPCAPPRQDGKVPTRAIPADVRDELMNSAGVNLTDQQAGPAALDGQNKAPGSLSLHVWAIWQHLLAFDRTHLYGTFLHLDNDSHSQIQPICDLTTIRHRLPVYQSPAEFIDDVQLMVKSFLAAHKLGDWAHNFGLLMQAEVRRLLQQTWL